LLLLLSFHRVHLAYYSPSAMASSVLSSLAVAEKVATFARQHAALTTELDELARLMVDLPDLESALAYMNTSIAAAEPRIAQGRAKLRNEWRAHTESLSSASSSRKGKEDMQKQAQIQQELAWVFDRILASSLPDFDLGFTRMQ
jgi:hypothetical protein